MERDEVADLRQVARSELDELVAELRRPDGPRSPRVEHLLAVLRRVLDRLEQRSTSETVDTVEEEQSLTSFRVLRDDVEDLERRWLHERRSVERSRERRRAHLKEHAARVRTLAAAAEAVEALRLALDGATVDLTARRTAELDLGSIELQPLLVEDLLSWVGEFVSSEGPRLIADGGADAISLVVAPTARLLERVVEAAAVPPQDPAKLPDGYTAIAVQDAVRDLAASLRCKA
ncbi:MAG TPA: hypothetical protein VGF23_24835 [Gaiellaceae bacterium]